MELFSAVLCISDSNFLIIELGWVMDVPLAPDFVLEYLEPVENLHRPPSISSSTRPFPFCYSYVWPIPNLREIRNNLIVIVNSFSILKANLAPTIHVNYFIMHRVDTEHMSNVLNIQVV